MSSNPFSAAFAWVWELLVKLVSLVLGGQKKQLPPPNNGAKALPAAASASANEAAVAAANKLRNNISSKGVNSYYYAHKDNNNQASIVRNEPPKLLQSGSSSRQPTRLGTSFDSFAWADSAKSVSVYVPFALADQVDDSAVSLQHGQGEFRFTVTHDKHDYWLFKPKLHGHITAAAWKKKKGKFVITLQKADATKAWHRLDQ